MRDSSPLQSITAHRLSKATTNTSKWWTPLMERHQIWLERLGVVWDRWTLREDFTTNLKARLATLSQATMAVPWNR